MCIRDRYGRACFVRAAGDRGQYWRDEFVEREDRGRGEAGEHDDRTSSRCGEADRFAGLERDAVRDDAGIGQLRDDTIGNISLIHISEPTRLLSSSYAVFCLKKNKE